MVSQLRSAAAGQAIKTSTWSGKISKAKFGNSARLGGQVNLAAALPGRAEFGGVCSNLQQELQRSSVELRPNSSIDEAGLRAFGPDHVIIATGASMRLPAVEVDGIDLVDAWSPIRGEARPGNRVVITDWSCDWNGLGAAEMLARDATTCACYRAAAFPSTAACATAT